MQAAEHDVGEGLSERELMELGKEVGIPDLYLQRALVEEQTRDTSAPEEGIGPWLLGPRSLHAQRVVTDAAQDTIEAIDYWMTEKELMAVKRRYQNATSWEAKKDFFSSVKRELGMGGRQYVLAQAQQVSAQVIPTSGHSHVQLTADLNNTRRSHMQAGTAVAGLGILATLVGATLGVAVYAAIIPAVLGVLGALVVMRRRKEKLERVQVGLEQVLDRLERHELKPPPPTKKQLPGTISRIADEIKKNLGV